MYTHLSVLSVDITLLDECRDGLRKRLELAPGAWILITRLADVGDETRDCQSGQSVTVWEFTSKVPGAGGWRWGCFAEGFGVYLLGFRGFCDRVFCSECVWSGN